MDRIAPASLAETALAGAAGGLLLTLAGVPAGWLCGSAIAVAALAVAGRPMFLSTPVADTTFLVLGTSMGSAVTPRTLDDAQLWPMSIVLLLVSVAVTMALGAWYLRRVHGWDPATARLSSTPGGLTAVLMLATNTVARFPIVALSQTLRQTALISLIPVALMLGVPAAPTPAAPIAGGWSTVVMLGAGFVGSALATRLKVPGGRLIGAMLASAALHVSGLVDGRLAMPILVVAYILMGAVIGSRFRGAKLADLRATVLPALGCIALTVVVSLGFALACQRLTGVPFAEIWLAYAPGGVEAMTVMAYALDLDPSYVSTHHVIRLLALILLSPLWTATILKGPEKAAT